MPPGLSRPAARRGRVLPPTSRPPPRRRAIPRGAGRLPRSGVRLDGRDSRIVVRPFNRIPGLTGRSQRTSSTPGAASIAAWLRTCSTYIRIHTQTVCQPLAITSPSRCKRLRIPFARERHDVVLGERARAELEHPPRREVLEEHHASASRRTSSASGFSAPDRSPGSSPTATARTARRRILAERVRGSCDDAHDAARLERLARAARSTSVPQLGRHVGAGRVDRRPEAPDRLALRAVRHADRRRLGDRRMRQQLGLDLGRPDALAGHVERLVGAPEHEPLAVVVELGPVAVAPDARVHRPVGLEVALRVAEHAAGHRRPRLLADELADRAAHRLAVGVEDVDVHAQRRAAERARPSSARPDTATRNAPPTSVPPEKLISGRLPSPTVSAEPAVGVLVPRLAGGAEDAQRRQVGSRRPGPAAFSARISVGETPSTATRWRSTSSHTRSGSGVSGAPS